MSATIETIGTIDKVTDHDCGNYRIGEIWSDPTFMVEAHIDRYGEYGYEQFRDYALQILHVAQVRIRSKRSQEYQSQCSAGKGSE
jgi:hypothetical protein